MIELDRYRTLFKLHPNLRAEYSEWEERLRPSSLSEDGACKRGSVVGFYGHENRALGSLVMSFGQVLQIRSYILDDKDFNQAAWVLHEAGNDIRLVPLGLIRFVAYPTFDGKWNIIYGQRDFATLFTDEPCFGDLLPLSEEGFGIEADFQDPALSALQHLVTKHGMSSLVDAGRVKSIMRDLAPEPRWGPDVISQAVELGIVERLLGESPDYELLRTVLVRKLSDRGPAEDRAQWAINRLAIVAGRYTAREMFWDALYAHLLDDDCHSSQLKDRKAEYTIRKQRHQACSIVDDINEYAKAHFVSYENSEQLRAGRWWRGFDIELKEIDPDILERYWRTLTVVRGRDVSDRLLFSYVFQSEACAINAIQGLRAFYSNRRKMLERARAECLVTELSMNGREHRLTEATSSAKQETPSWDERISQAQGDELWKLPLFCRDGDEWCRLASEGNLDESDYAVMFIGERRDQESLMVWLSQKLAICRYHPSELPVVIAYDDGYVADCAAKSYAPGFSAKDWVRRVEEVYGSASLFTIWQRGTIWDLQKHVVFLEKKLPRPVDLRAEKEIWEKELRAAGTWGEYSLENHPAVDDLIRTKAIKRFLDRYQRPAESLGAYFARSTLEFRELLKSFS